MSGAKVEETEREIHEVIDLHIEELIEDGLSAPQVTSIVEYRGIAA